MSLRAGFEAREHGFLRSKNREASTLSEPRGERGKRRGCIGFAYNQLISKFSEIGSNFLRALVVFLPKTSS